jgi:hypothetical protein
MKPRKRNFGREYAQFHATPEQKKARASRNAARRKLMAEGRVKKGDGKDVDHVNSQATDNRPSNLRVRSRRANRSDHRRVYS